MAAKKKELILRDAVNSETWDSTFQGIEIEEPSFAENETEQLIKKHFEDMTDTPANECRLTHFFFEMCQRCPELLVHAMRRRRQQDQNQDGRVAEV